MGNWKEHQIEQEEKWAKGYLAPDNRQKFVCDLHFENQYLQKYIKTHGHHGYCSYCRKKSVVLDMADFIEFVGERITSFLGPIDNENLYLANSFLDKEDRENGIPGWTERGPFLAPADAAFYRNVYELMHDYDLITDYQELNDDIASCFYVDQWIRKDPTSFLLKDELIQLWNNFSQLVKTKVRYTFFRNDSYYASGDYMHIPDYKIDIIAEISNLVCLLEDTIDVGTQLYRGRPEDDEAPFKSFKSLTAPPAIAAKENRMSPYGISVFYGSFDKDTPIKEIKNYLVGNSKKIYLGQFEVSKKLKVINLCNIPIPNFWMEDEDDWQRYAFLHLFHKEIAKPMDNNDSKLEYIPSQVFCEYLRFIQKTKEGNTYDGIIYSSALTSKRNIALFYDNKTSADVLTLVNVNTY